MSPQRLPSPAATDRLYQIALYELVEGQETPAGHSRSYRTDQDFLQNSAWVADFLNTALPEGFSVQSVEPYRFVNPGPPLYGYFELRTPQGAKLFTLDHGDLSLVWHERATGSALREAKARHEQRCRMEEVARQAATDTKQFLLALAAKVKAKVDAAELTAEQASDIESVRHAPRGTPKAYEELGLDQLAQIARILGMNIQDM